MKSLFGSLITAAALLAPALSNAAPIIFTFTGEDAALQLNGVNKSNIDFTVKFSADTANVKYHDPATPWYRDLTGVVQFSDGVNLTFNSGYVFNNQTVSVAGFGTSDRGDLFDLFEPSLGSYDLMSSFSQVSSNNIFALDQWVNLSTSAGNLSVYSVASGTFSAQLESTAVPEPVSVALLALGLAGLGLSQRKRFISS